MHIFDVETHFQGGWALVAEQFPYAAERPVRLCWIAISAGPEDDDRLAMHLSGEGG